MYGVTVALFARDRLSAPRPHPPVASRFVNATPPLPSPPQSWLQLPTAQQRLEAPFTADMKAQVLSYYVHHYCTHYMSEAVREAYASIPQVRLTAARA